MEKRTTLPVFTPVTGGLSRSLKQEVAAASSCLATDVFRPDSPLLPFVLTSIPGASCSSPSRPALLESYQGVQDRRTAEGKATVSCSHRLVSSNQLNHIHSLQDRIKRASPPAQVDHETPPEVPKSQPLHAPYPTRELSQTTHPVITYSFPSGQPGILKR